MPVIVVPTSSATVAIATFITELSSVIRNCPAASVSRTVRARCPVLSSVGGHGQPIVVLCGSSFTIAETLDVVHHPHRVTSGRSLFPFPGACR